MTRATQILPELARGGGSHEVAVGGVRREVAVCTATPLHHAFGAVPLPEQARGGFQ